MIDALTYNTKHLIGALVAGGVKYFVLSPGHVVRQLHY